MQYLLIVSFLWSLSFGVIRTHLSELDPVWVSLCRTAISALIFLPFVGFRRTSFSARRVVLKMLAIGSIQLGVMNISMIYALRYLPAYQVALLTITTPIYVLLCGSLINRQLLWKGFLILIPALIGPLIIINPSLNTFSIEWKGILWLQLSNLSFAFGQTMYARVMRNAGDSLNDIEAAAWLNLGATVVCGIFLACLAGLTHSPGFSIAIQNKEQAFSILYLALIPSALGYFLWNLGARRVKTTRLAIANNFKIPMAVVVSFCIFGERFPPLRFSIGVLCILFSLWLDHFWVRKTSAQS